MQHLTRAALRHKLQGISVSDMWLSCEQAEACGAELSVNSIISLGALQGHRYSVTVVLRRRAWRKQLGAEQLCVGFGADRHSNLYFDALV